PVGDKVAVVGETLTFTVRVSDPDEDLLTWAADNLPDGAVFVGGSIYGTATFTWTPAEAAIGTHEITLRVTDSGNGETTPASDEETIHVIVRATNNAPTLEPIGDRTGDQAQPFELQLAATDPDGDALTYSATGLPTGARLDARTGLFTWTPDAAQSGTFSITFHVSDGSAGDS